MLAGEPLLVHAARRLARIETLACLVVAAPLGHETAVHDLIEPLWRDRLMVVTGGVHRQESVAAALAALPAGPDVVLVHDAARALTPASLVEGVVDAVRDGHDAVIPVLPVADTIVHIDSSGAVAGWLPRPRLRAVQTPQGFRRRVLEAAHAAAATDPGAPATDDAGLVHRLGVPVHTVAGDNLAWKITTSLDLRLAEALVTG